MLQKFFSAGWHASDAPENIVIIDQLAAAHGRLPTDCGVVDLRSEEGCEAAAKFLGGAELAAQRLGLKPAPRGYRAGFSPNYRSLFPDWGRHYRADVLAASAEQHSTIYVNGDQFELSPEAVRRGEALQGDWHSLGDTLARWGLARRADTQASKPTRGELAEVAEALAQLDRSWASFESVYIPELIEIEERARLLVVEAAGQEARLRALEALEAQDAAAAAARRRAERDLVATVARLNSVANFRGKGRSDLEADILESADAVLRRPDASPAQALAADVVESFGAMRAYLRRVSGCLERVDPHLCNNGGLVAQLLDWEESWEVGARFVRDAKLFEAVSDLASEIRAARRLAPSLTLMLRDCDVELFMALPRLVWLCFLAESRGPRAELLRTLLPHRFAAAGGAPLAAEGRPGPDPELQALLSSFREATASLGGRDVAWRLLVLRAVAGAAPAAAARQGPEAVVEDLMRELERWSMELQRHCPGDWNQLSAVLVQCLVESPKQRCLKFEV